MNEYFGIACFSDTLQHMAGPWLKKLGIEQEQSGSQIMVSSAEESAAFRGWRLDPAGSRFIQSRLGHQLFFKGAIHNRNDLVDRLEGAVTCKDQDASIVMAAYLKWGAACFSKLIGEFSLTLWEPRDKTVFLVRDIAGILPLFYRRDGERLLFSTDIAVLLTDPSFHPALEDRYIAGFLSGYSPDSAMTPYKGIHVVRPATFITVSEKGSSREETYWQVDADQRLRYRSDREYDEHFLELFAEAVRERLRSRAPVLADLSGGLDSSSIVCMADRVVDPSETPLGVETLSYIYDESPSCDERDFIAAVEDGRGRQGHHLRDAEHRFRVVFEGSPQDLSHPENCVGGFEWAREDLVLRLGAHRVLSGEGGDEVMGGVTQSQSVLADFATRFQLFKFHGELCKWADFYQQPYLKVLAGVGRRILPQWTWGRVATALPDWYRPDFIKRTQLRGRILLPSHIARIKTPSSWDQAGAVWSAIDKLSSKSQYRKSSAEYSYPFLHRPLIEFMQAIPPEQKLLPGRNRVLMRRALKGILPSAIADRKGKAFGNEDLHRSFARQWGSIRAMLKDNHFFSEEYIDPKIFLPVLERSRHGLNRRIGDVFRVIALESWLRNLSGCKPERRLPTGSEPEPFQDVRSPLSDARRSDTYEVFV